MTTLYLLCYDVRVKRLWYYYIYLLLAWGSFRYFVRLPEVIDELWFKPLLWLVPLFWWNLAMKEKVVMFGKQKLLSLVLGVMVGVAYFLLLKYGNWRTFELDVNILGVAVATAVTEELVFSGFVVGYLEKIRSGKWINLLIVGLMTAVIRLPILLFVYRANLNEVIGVLLFVFASGVINAWIRVRTGDVTGSIVARLSMNLASLV